MYLYYQILFLNITHLKNFYLIKYLLILINKLIILITKTIFFNLINLSQ
jgi:hypothetical protein